jgi:hypothetical protein
MKRLIALVVLCACFSGCTQNMMTKDFGGKMTVRLNPGEKLVNVTWKDSDMWYLTRPMQPSDMPETYMFQEKSTFGVWQGVMTIIESR